MNLQTQRLRDIERVGAVIRSVLEDGRPRRKADVYLVVLDTLGPITGNFAAFETASKKLGVIVEGAAGGRRAGTWRLATPACPVE